MASLLSSLRIPISPNVQSAVMSLNPTGELVGISSAIPTLEKAVAIGATATATGAALKQLFPSLFNPSPRTIKIASTVKAHKIRLVHKSRRLRNSGRKTYKHRRRKR